MPYIDKETRNLIDPSFRELTEFIKNNPIEKQSGILNYIITNIVLIWLEKTERKYNDYNSIIGVLNLVQDEIKNRLIKPYEKLKLENNGDIEYFQKLRAKK